MNADATHLIRIIAQAIHTSSALPYSRAVAMIRQGLSTALWHHNAGAVVDRTVPGMFRADTQSQRRGGSDAPPFASPPRPRQQTPAPPPRPTPQSPTAAAAATTPPPPRPPGPATPATRPPCDFQPQQGAPSPFAGLPLTPPPPPGSAAAAGSPGGRDQKNRSSSSKKQQIRSKKESGNPFATTHARTVAGTVVPPVHALYNHFSGVAANARTLFREPCSVPLPFDDEEPLPAGAISKSKALTAAHNDCTPTDQCIASTTQPLQQPDRFFPTISGCGSSVTSVAAMAQVQGAAASGEGNAQR